MREYKLNVECEQFITHLKRERWANNTCLAYTVDLCLLFEMFPVPPLDITKQQIEEYLYKSKSESTFRRRKASLNKFFSYLQANELRNDNPMVSVGVMKEKQEVMPKYLTTDEMKRIKKLADKKCSPRDIAIFSTFANTGIRESELRNLDKDDITNEYLTVRNGKGGKMRRIPLQEKTFQDIHNYLNSRTDSNPALFISRDNGRLSRTSIVNTMKGLFKLIGRDDEGLTCHSVRHSFCTGYILAGVDITYISRLAGHSSTSVTDKYVHLLESNLKEKSMNLL